MKKYKQTILYVLKILKEGSNRNHPIAQTVIARTLNLIGIKCDRKTVARDIDCLIAFGYDIVKVKGVGCYLNNREFDREDIDNLLKGVSSLDISVDKKVSLIKKVKSLININER